MLPKQIFVKGLEFGRSMVEMLGTLAVMGVISLVGIGMYNYAMNYMKVNAILYEVNKLAHGCMAQVNLMDRECNLAEYGNQIENFTTSTLSFVEKNYFGIQIANVPKEICNKIHAQGFPIASQILPETCETTNNMVFIFDNKLSGKTVGVPQKCTVSEDCQNSLGARICGANGFCTCANGQTPVSTGCCAVNKILNGICCVGGITVDEITGQKLCCWKEGRCCPSGQIWVNGICESCENETAFTEPGGVVDYCRVCPQRVQSSWKCSKRCFESDQVVVNGQCHCPFERPIMLNDGTCHTCADGGQTLNGSNVPLGYNRVQIARYCNYKGGQGGYSWPCANGEVGLWQGETYTENGEIKTLEPGYGKCVPCSEVTTEQLNSRARCESCGGVWQSSAAGTQDEWAFGICQNRQL